MEMKKLRCMNKWKNWHKKPKNKGRQRIEEMIEEMIEGTMNVMPRREASTIIEIDHHLKRKNPRLITMSILLKKSNHLDLISEANR